jgi:hypothetical protein
MKTMSKDRFFQRFSVTLFALIDVTSNSGTLRVQEPIF